MGQQFRVAAIQRAQFARGAEMEFAVKLLIRVFLAQQGERANALDDVVFQAVFRRGVTDRRGGYEWKLGGAGKLAQRLGTGKFPGKTGRENAARSQARD